MHRLRHAAVAALATVVVPVAGVAVAPQASAATPVVASTSPSAATNDRSVSPARITINGTGFAAGDTATLVNDSNSSFTIPASATTFVGETQLKATFDIRSEAPGTYKVNITRGGTTTTGVPGTFTVASAGAPTLTSAQVSPSNLPQGSSNLTVTFSGTNLARGATVSIIEPTDDSIDANDITATYAGYDKASGVITAKVTVPGTFPTAAPTGARNVRIVNTGSSPNSVVCSGCATVVEASGAKATITNVQPAELGQGASAVRLTITGTNLTGAEFSFGDRSGNPAVTPGQGVTQVSEDKAQASSTKRVLIVSVADDATNDDPTLTPQLAITAENSGGTSDAYTGFAVGGGPKPTGTFAFTNNTKPTFTITSPNNGFADGDQIRLIPSSGASIEATGESYAAVDSSEDRLSGTVDLTRVAPGKYALQVYRANLGQRTLADAVTIAAIPAVFTAPKSLIFVHAPVSAMDVTVNVTNGAFGDRLQISGSNITATVAAVTATTETFRITTSASGTRTGYRDLTILHADDTASEVCTSCMLVTSNANFVGSLYREPALFNRVGEPAGKAYWTGLLNAGTKNRTQVAREFLRSDEYFAKLPKDDYQRFLGRTASPSEVSYWSSQLKAGMTHQRFEELLLSSDEYFAKAGATNTKFVERNYTTALGRPGDSAGIAYWAGRLDRGEVTRAQVANLFFSLTEGSLYRLANLYVTFLHRPADEQGKQFFASQYRQGVREEDLDASLLGSLEYLFYAATHADDA